MIILHLTDFHFKLQKQHDHQQSRIIDDIIKKVKETGEKVDFLLFTGDFVFSGDEIGAFDGVRKILTEKILKELGLTATQLFICPGNHDVNRKVVSKAIVSQLDNIKSNQELDNYIRPNEIDYQNSLLPLKNYQSFVTQLFGKGGGGNTFGNGWSTHRRSVDGKKIGIFCANTAWRAVGSQDEGKLLLPLSHVKEALSDLKGCDFKIILHHHPLSQLAIHNQFDIEDLIYNNFNVSFSGHLHKDSKSIMFTNSDGILKLASGATLADSDGSTIGFSLLNFDLENLKVSGHNYRYDRQSDFFYTGKEIEVQLPVSKEKEKQNKFRQRLRELHDLELDNADDLFLNGKTNKDRKGFKDLWTNPVISTKSPEEAKNASVYTQYNCDEFIKSNRSFLIMGDDKCGKTSLLKKIQLDCFTHFNIHEKIPLYIDTKKIDKSVSVVNKIEKEIITYYATSRAGAQALMSSTIFVLLLDNLELKNQEEQEWLEELIRCFTFPQIIICTEQNSISKYQNVTIGGEDVVNIYFHSLKKKQVRELAEKFYGNSDSKQEVLTRINDIFAMLAIPFNFWSVSLFMWVFKESNKDITNDVDLVDLYVESILEREKLIKNKGSFSYEKYKQYLAYLSKFLLSKKEKGYSATRDEILIYTRDYLSENPRNNTDASTVWQYVETKEIIKEIQPGYFTFRLNGVFEYFLAHYLKLDEKFRNDVISDDNAYLSFKNELEMYAGSNRGDEDFVRKIFNKTKTIFYNVTSSFDRMVIDKMLSEVHFDNIAHQMNTTAKTLLQESFTEEEVDDFQESMAQSTGLAINENCEVKVKQPMPIDEENVISLERALYILGRIYKNSDDIKNNQLIDEMFDYLINTAIAWGFKLFQSFKPEELSESGEKQQLLKLVNLMKAMLPIIVQTRISDMIGANNMQGIIKQKLEGSVGTPGEENQFKRFILLYLLADIDLIHNIKYIEESILTVKMPILRYSIMMKILYYYNFKTGELNPTTKLDTEKKLQAMYRDMSGKFNNSIFGKDAVNTMFQSIDKNKVILKGSGNK